MSAALPAVVRSLHAWRQGQLAEVAAAFQRACLAWSQDWGLDLAGPVTCRLPCSGDLDLHWQALGSAAQPEAWLHLPPPAQDAVGAQLFEGATAATPIASRVASACLAAFRDSLSRALEPFRPGEAAPPVSEAMDAWAGWVCVQLPLGAMLLLDGAMARRLVARTTAARSALAAVEEALAPHAMQLQVRLGECELDLGSLQDLQVGDVVRLPHAVTEPAEIVDAEGTPLFQGMLVRSGSRKAVELVATAMRP